MAKRIICPCGEGEPHYAECIACGGHGQIAYAAEFVDIGREIHFPLCRRHAAAVERGNMDAILSAAQVAILDPTRKTTETYR